MRILIGGPDGCGKSTLADLLTQRLAADGVTVRRLHYRPHVLFARAGGGDGADASNDPHGGFPRGFAASSLKLVVTLLDYLMFEVTRRRGPARRQVQIQERGWWDQAIDPRRYRLHPASRWLVLMLGRLLPRPELAVVLTGPATLIRERKRELEIDEINRQSKEWTHRAPTIARRSLILDTRRPPDDAVAHIYTAMTST